MNNLPDIFFTMKIEVEGSNIAEVGWEPSVEDFSFDGGSNSVFYKEAMEDYTKSNKNVCFKNLRLNWDSCDCGDGYGCTHGNWVYEIDLFNDKGEVISTINVEDNESLIFECNVNKFSFSLPIKYATVGDFYRACKILGYDLELTDYAKSLLI